LEDAEIVHEDVRQTAHDILATGGSAKVFIDAIDLSRVHFVANADDGVVHAVSPAINKNAGTLARQLKSNSETNPGGGGADKGRFVL